MASKSVRILAGLVVALSALLLPVACSSQKAEKTAEVTKDGDGREQNKRERTQAVPVKVADAELGSISQSLEFTSKLETESAVDVYAESSGLILEILVEVGDRVSEGDPLAQLESDEEKVELAEAKARYEHLQRSFDRTLGLHERKLINEQQFEVDRFELEEARFRYERSRIQLEDTTVRAPVDGVITDRMAQKGIRVTASSKLYSIMNLDDIFAMAYVPGRYLQSIKPGLEAQLTSDTLEDVSYRGWIDIVSPVIDPSSGTFRVKVAVEQTKKYPIFPGLFVNVRIVIDTRDEVILVPREAVVYEDDREYLFKVVDGKAQKLPLRNGYVSSVSVEVLDRVVAGDRIIVVGQNALKDGTAVKVIEDAVATTPGVEPAEHPETKG